MKRDANDVAGQHGVEALLAETEVRAAAAMQASIDEFPTVETLHRKFNGHYREPVVHGLLRVGEVANIVAPPKAGKSFMGYHWAFCVATGGHLLGMGEWKCEQGPVVILDNELHQETLGARLPRVREAMNLHRDAEELIRVKDFRGSPIDLNELEPYFLKMRILKPKLVVLDALYKFLPEGTNENDNSQMTRIYNKIIHYAALANTSILVIHHTSKGNQAEKDISDVGAGAQAGARAADLHTVLREHDEQYHYVLESLVRTWEQPAKLTCEYRFPMWWNNADVDPTKIKGRKIVKERVAATVPAAIDPATGIFPVLNHDWQPQSLLLRKLIPELKMTEKAAGSLIQMVCSKYNLFDMMPIDGEKDCGLFLVKRGKSLMFKLKG